MIHSMTAFCRKEHVAPWGTLVWELRSVNHRYLEISPRLPDTLRELENSIRDCLRQALSRGKVECILKLKTENTLPAALEVNQEYVLQLLDASQRIRALTGGSGYISTETLMNWPGVLQSPETDQSVIQQTAHQLLKETLEEFIAHRQREGSVLSSIILDRLTKVETQIAQVRELMPEILKTQRERLLSRLQEFQANPDQERLEQELVFLAQKSDVDEELDRLATHAQEVRRTINQGGAVGRRLDFLMQELNREANTLGSKSVNAQTSQIAVELKVLIEQMREQIQNIE